MLLFGTVSVTTDFIGTVDMNNVKNQLVKHPLYSQVSTELMP